MLTVSGLAKVAILTTNVDAKDSPANGTSASGLPADERLVSLGGSGPGARRRFPETPLTPGGGDFLTSSQTVSQSAGPGASVPCVRHGSQAAEIDRGQLVGRRLKDIAVVVHLHEFAPVGRRPASGRDLTWNSRSQEPPAFPPHLLAFPGF